MGTVVGDIRHHERTGRYSFTLGREVLDILWDEPAPGIAYSPLGDRSEVLGADHVLVVAEHERAKAVARAIDAIRTHARIVRGGAA